MKKNAGLALRSPSPSGEGGLTLIEIMVVVLILGIIAGVVATNMSGKVDPAKAKLTETQIKRLKGEVELFKADKDRYPETLEDLVPRYLDEVPKDCWNRSFVYRTPGVRAGFDIVSLGEDGLPGGEGANADLWSHRATK
jgi:general secretion pathway protein G